MESEKFQEWMDRIFQIHPRHSNRLNSRESSNVEFKQSFRKSFEDYGKTIASFANNNGGFLIFGVKDSPHEVVGLNSRNFEEFDPSKLTEFLNKTFSPEIKWSKHIYEFQDMKFGILYIEESQNKPIVAISNGGDHIREADIYYRYRGRSERIKYPELREILEQNRQKEQILWMQHLKRISAIGVDNAAIFNPDDGTVTGKSGAFIIDKTLLPKLTFIREGEFKEVIGAPAIRLVGDAQVLAAGDVIATKTVVQRQSIRAKDIIEFFLEQKNPSEPTFFLEQICYESMGYFPFYYYCSLCEIKKSGFSGIIKKQSSKMQSKRTTLERMQKNDSGLFAAFKDTGTDSANIKKEIREKIIRKDDISLNNDNLQKFFEALRSMRKAEVDVGYIFPIVKEAYNIATSSNAINTELYKAICYLDKLHFCPDDFYEATK